MDVTIKLTTVMEPRVYPKKDGTQGRTFQFVGETQGAYPKTIHFSVFGEDRFTAMQLVEGAMYQIEFDIESRPWRDTYITNIIAWRATRTDVVQPHPAPQAQTVQQQGYYAPQQQQSPAPAPSPLQQGGYNQPENDEQLPF